MVDEIEEARRRVERLRPKVLDTRGVLYFPSGSYHPGEIRGLAEAGFNVGTTALLPKGKLAEAEWELGELAGTDSLVFIDSGAFSEIQFYPDRPPQVVAPITAADWERIFSEYERLGRKLGSQLYVVAPDRVADQDYTLDLLDRYAERIQELSKLGVNVIVPHQKGYLSLSEFNDLAGDILGGIPMIVGVPMKKDATSLHDIVQMLIEAPGINQLHLLGMGPKRKDFVEIVSALRAIRPGIKLYSDSVLIRSMVGTKSGPGGGPRALTAATQEADLELEERTFHEGVGGPDYTDLISEPSAWMTPAEVRKFLDAIGLKGPDRREAEEDLDAWLQEDDRYLWPHIEYALDTAWKRWLQSKGGVEWRKARALRSTLGETRTTDPRGQVKLF